MKTFIGLDAHCKSSTFVVVDSKGNLRERDRVETLYRITSETNDGALGSTFPVSTTTVNSDDLWRAGIHDEREDAVSIQRVHISGIVCY